MRHPLACVMVITTVIIFIGTDYVNGQFSSVAIPGYKIKIVGCFKENPAKKNIPTLLFSDVKGVNSKTKVDYKNFQPYIQGVVRRCATATKGKSLSFFAIGYIGECKSGSGVSATYARSGSSTDCKNGAGTKCGKNQDCVGGGPKSNFVYKLEPLSTTPTTKPTTKATTKPTTAKPTTKGPAAKFSALSCQNYLVAIKTAAGGSAGKPQVPTPAGASTKPTVAGKSTGPTVATPSTGAPTSSPQSSVEAKVKSIYKGYSCLVCLKTVNSSSSTVFLLLQFTCQGQHLKKLVAGLGVSNIIKAECYPPPCGTTGSMYPCPSPCGMSSCTMSPSLPYPSVCPAPAPVSYPGPIPPPQCPMSCPSRCAPACNSICCRSLIGHKNRIGQSAKKSSTFNADDFEDDADDEEEEDNDEDSDDTDIDDTN